MSALLETRINPFKRIRLTEGKVFLADPVAAGQAGPC
jgi:hypothetical protein